MKGIVFDLLEQLAIRDHGEDAWDDILADAGVAGGWTTVGTYPHEDLVALAEATGRRLGCEAGDVIRWFGREAIPVFAASYPHLFERHAGVRSFVLSLNDIIHPEVRKLYPGAQVPHFDYELDPGGTVRMAYRSERQLCALAEGLLDGTALHYAQPLAHRQVLCVHRGDDCCVFELEIG